MNKLLKALALSKDQVLTIGLSRRMSVASVVASTSAAGVRILAIVNFPVVVENDTLGITPEV